MKSGFKHENMGRFGIRSPKWLPPATSNRVDHHFKTACPQVPRDQIRAALANINPSVRKEIEALLERGKTSEAEVMLLQYVTTEDRIGQIRTAERSKRRLFGFDNRSFGSLVYWIAVIAFLLMVFFLFPWLRTGRI